MHLKSPPFIEQILGDSASVIKVNNERFQVVLELTVYVLWQFRLI
jgi:hypothetical protein